jgi:hypothetical protein
MAARALGTERPPTTGPPLEPYRANDLGEPAWLWDSVRQQFWQPADLARSIPGAAAFTPSQREAIAYWWSLLAAIEGLGPRAYAAAFLRASEQHESEQVRWSLLAMLRDGLHHEQLCHLVLRRLTPDWPARQAPRTALDLRLRQVYEQAECYWDGCRRALSEHGIGVAEGGLLLGALVTGALYEGWATSCTIPAFSTAFRHTARDAQRHQAVLRALTARDWPRLTAAERVEAATQVEATASLLSTALLDPPAWRPDPQVNQEACRAGFGVPSGEQRQELLRDALLEVRSLQHRYGIRFAAIPELAIAGA